MPLSMEGAGVSQFAADWGDSRHDGNMPIYMEILKKAAMMVQIAAKAATVAGGRRSRDKIKIF